MPHLRKRYLEDVLRKIGDFSPLVGVLGHRQVGKTTLLEKVCKRYFTLDQAEELESARSNPAEYLRSKGGRWVAIDECQSAPELFPALKDQVRKDKRPGQFILSGSVRFTSRKAIRESLTGRIINLELFPFTIDELEGNPLPSTAKDALEASSLESFARNRVIDSPRFHRRRKLMESYFECGGLPGVCFIRDAKLRHLKMDDQLRTLLDRDLRMIQRTTLSLHDLRNLCAALARFQGSPLDYTVLQRETRITFPTLKKLLFALEAIFLIRLLPIEGGRKGHVVYFEDQGEAAWLSPNSQSHLEKLAHFCFTQIRAQFEYRLGERTETFQYRTRGGAFVPLAYRNKSGTLGIILIEEPSRAMSVLASANSFLKTYPKSNVLILHPERDRRLIQPRVLMAPLLEFV